DAAKRQISRPESDIERFNPDVCRIGNTLTDETRRSENLFDLSKQTRHPPEISPNDDRDLGDFEETRAIFPNGPPPQPVLRSLYNCLPFRIFFLMDLAIHRNFLTLDQHVSEFARRRNILPNTTLSL